jgi:hypothetical protein
MIYLQNIIVGSEMKLFLLISMLAFVFHNSSNSINNNIYNDNIPDKLTHRE